MEVRASKSALLSELGLLQGIVEKKTTYPILSAILMEALPDKGLRMVATDLDTTVVTAAAAEIVESGKVAVSSKVFTDIVRSLPSEELVVRTDGTSLVLESGSFRSTLSVHDADDFPNVPLEAEGDGFSVDLELLKLLLARASVAAPRAEVEAAGSGAGVLLRLASGRIEVAGTDRRRLVVVSAATDSRSVPFEKQLLPRKLVNEVLKMPGGSAEIYLMKNHLGIVASGRFLASRLIEFRFPNYASAIVRDNPYRAIVGREQLLSSLRRVSLLSHERGRAVEMSFSPGSLTLSSKGHKLGQAEEMLEIEYDGASFSLTMNAQYLIDFLAVLNTEKVEIQAKDENVPCVLVPVDDDPRVEECCYVLMPMRV